MACSPSPSVCVGNVLPTFITTEDKNETQEGDTVSRYRERGMSPHENGRDLLGNKIPQAFAELSSGSFCLHHRGHHSHGRLEQSREMPSLFLGQRN